MLDFGWSEIAIVAVLAVIVLGPKELPNAMRTAAKWVRKARRMVGDFQRHIDDVVKEAELDDLKKEVNKISRTDIGQEINKAVDPDGSVQRSLHIDDRVETKAAAGASDAEPKAAAGSGGTETADAGAASGQSAGSDGAAVAPEKPKE